MNPGTIFTVASIRVQEITIGVLCATLVHSLVLPRKVSHRVHARVAAVLADSERWTCVVLGNAPDAVLALDRARSAVDMLDLYQLSAHCPSTPCKARFKALILEALHRRLLAVLSLSGAIDNALTEMHALPHDVPAKLASLFEQVQSWLAAGQHARPHGNQKADGRISHASNEPVWPRFMARPSAPQIDSQSRRTRSRPSRLQTAGTASADC